MTKLTISEYAELRGISRQAVYQSIKSGKMSRMKGISNIDTFKLAKGKIIYVLTYNPEHENPEPLPD